MTSLKKNVSLKVLAVIFAFFIFSIGKANAETQTYEKPVENPSAENPAQTDSPKDAAFLLLTDGAELDLSERMERTSKTLNEIRETYSIKKDSKVSGTLYYDVYHLKNGDLYYYFKYTSKGAASEDQIILLPYAVERFDLRTVEYPYGMDMTKSVMSLYSNQTTEENVLAEIISPGSVFLDSADLNCFLSYSSVYKTRSHMVREEVYDKGRNVDVTPDGIKITLPAVENGFSEQWGIFSNGTLVNWNDYLTVGELKIADLNRIRKWGGDGQYYTIPNGYSPYIKNGFYRNSANHIGDKFIRSQGRMFENFGYITMDTLIKTQNSYGYWSTSTRADWLYKDYGIGAGYFDTRWDTDAALSLLRGYRKFQEPLAIEAASTYADFYCDFALTNNYKTKSGGILVYDYGFNAIPGIKTHVSLNHLVSEMNFLLEMYITTGNDRYLEISGKILVGVRDTASSWINRRNGDLHYAYLPNGGYGLTDYQTLTLNDLRYAQSLLISVNGKEEASIKMLIDAKMKYLNKNNIPY